MSVVVCGTGAGRQPVPLEQALLGQLNGAAQLSWSVVFWTWLQLPNVQAVSHAQPCIHTPFYHPGQCSGSGLYARRLGYIVERALDWRG